MSMSIPFERILVDRASFFGDPNRLAMAKSSTSSSPHTINESLLTNGDRIEISSRRGRAFLLECEQSGSTHSNRFSSLIGSTPDDEALCHQQLADVARSEQVRCVKGLRKCYLREIRNLQMGR